MTERDRQTDFLMRLLVLADCKGDGDLQARIEQAQHDEKCLRFAFLFVGLIGGFALAGLGYCAVLHPDFLDNSAPTLVKKLPEPLRRIVGDLANEGRLLVALGMPADEQAD